MSAAAALGAFDPFDESAIPKPSEPMFARAGDGKFYTWKGRKYLRVTHTIGMAPGQGLMSYHAKVAALTCAAWLVHGGLYTPPMPTEAPLRTPEFDAMPNGFDAEDPEEDGALEALMAEIERYVDARPMLGITPERAIQGAVNWVSNMREPMRYRDHKGRIGSLAHLVRADIALGLRTSLPDVQYVAELASAKIGFDPAVLARYEALGKSKDDVILDLAFHALPHAVNFWTRHEAYRPEYEALGIESAVFSSQRDYAGSADGIGTYRKDLWQANNDGKWPFEPGLRKARVVEDDKTSNYLASSVRFQLGAYAAADFIGDYADFSEHPMPEIHGLVAWHSTPTGMSPPKAWGANCIQPFADTFLGLHDYVLGLMDLPRSSRGRKDKPQPKGQRDCPIFVGGGR